MPTKDKAKAAEQWKEWYAERREEVNAAKRAKRATDQGYLAKQRADYWSRPDAKRAYQRAYSKQWRAKQTPAKLFAISTNQRAARYGQGPLDHENLSVGPCTYCGRNNETVTWDHVVPLARGGANTASNCVRSCLSCNKHKHAKTPQEWREPDSVAVEATRERRRAYIRQWHREHYAELQVKRKAKHVETGHW